MGNVNTSYIAKRATALTNPLTNDSIFLQADNAALSAYVVLQNDLVSGTSRLDGKVFRVRASGKVITTASSTLIITLYWATTAKTAITYNGTGVSTTGATHTSGAYATTSGNWWIESKLTWDSVSKILGGQYEAFSSATPSVTTPTVNTAVTGVDLTVPGGGLIVGCHFGTTGTGNICTLTEFVSEVL